MSNNSHLRSAQTSITQTVRTDRLRSALALLAMLAIGLVASVKAACSRPTPPGVRETPTQLPAKTTILSNGLQIVTLEDHHAPVVTLEVYYRVGSKDEGPGRFGFAHLFEHMMFKGSKNVAPEAHAHYVEQLGGEYGADTGFDRTRFYETVPINALNRVLYLEADRMATLNVDKANLDSERQVVEEEYRLGVANSPYGVIDAPLEALVYPAGHPYAHDPIGNLNDLDAATLAEVRAFHETFYKPDNAVLVIVGDFATKDALKRIQHYFGNIPARGKPFPRREIPAATAVQSKRVVIIAPLAPIPMVVVAFPLPEPSSPDTPALELLATVLSGGRNSRLFHALVKTTNLSSRPTATLTEMSLGGYFVIKADALSGHVPNEVESAINAELDRLRREPVGDDELAKSKNLALTALVFGNDSTEDRAQHLGEAVILYGSTGVVNRSYERISAVTASDLLRVAKSYLTTERARVLYAMPPTSAAPSKAGAGQ